MSADLTVPTLPTFYYWTPKPGSGISSHLATWSSNTGPHPQWDITEWVLKADAEAALASLQARLEEAERLLRVALTDWQCNANLKDYYQAWDDEAWSRIEAHLAAIDAATQEKPYA